MDAKQLKAIEFMVTMPEMTDEQVAKECQVSRQTIYNWKKTDEFQKELRKALDDTWKEMSYKAQKRMNELMDSTNDSVALGASKYVLDSYGRGAVQKVDVNVNKLIGLEDDPS